MELVLTAYPILDDDVEAPFVITKHFDLLRRSPEQSGYDARLRVNKQDSGNIHQMVNGFMNSQEYRLRFGQP